MSAIGIMNDGMYKTAYNAANDVLPSICMLTIQKIKYIPGDGVFFFPTPETTKIEVAISRSL
jgi:hypothetical protein